MNLVKIAQRMDMVFGLVFAALSVYWLATGSYMLAGVGLLSAAISIASAKFVPARWLAKRMMLARLK